jgi:hypothetical protein
VTAIDVERDRVVLGHLRPPDRLPVCLALLRLLAAAAAVVGPGAAIADQVRLVLGAAELRIAQDLESVRALAAKVVAATQV